MPLSQPGSSRLGIALRIALLTWLVALATLLIFILITLPQQKRIYLQNLESKANSVAVSLRDVAAAAAINEDFAGVISACQTLLEGDPELDFLIVLKNDGFALINDQNGWQADAEIGLFWRPDQRQPAGRITTVPLLDRRVFHYAQPFDYSGIQWGWIHVGVSLEAYDRNIRFLYRNTLVLTLVCSLLSLLISLAYAKNLVRPILRLRHAVEQIACGDLSVRVDMPREDELGSLVHSVNSMADSLRRRDRILESVRFAAQQFLLTVQWQDALDDILASLGQAADASRAYLFQNFEDSKGRLHTRYLYEWTAEGVLAQRDNPELQALPYEAYGMHPWRTSLEDNQIISGPVSQFGTELRAILESQEIRSLIVIPVFVESCWWGFLGLDDCTHPRLWTDAEADSLRAATDMLGATIARQRIQNDLLEAKATLEQRVRERTRELQTQVSAKEHALSELAATQSSLMEVSRAAGMAEVATGVLHNVGNVLNSVNVSSALLIDRLRKSRVENVARLASLIREHTGDLPGFLGDDPRGRQIPTYLDSLGRALLEEHQLLLTETQSLGERIDHIKEIISMQQNYGRVSGVEETIPPEQLMEDALKLNADALDRHGVKVKREYQPLPALVVDKHKVLQILLNLINNAKYACEDGGGKTVTLRITPSASGDRVGFEVCDDGVGIKQENLTRIFKHGFTTRKSGHGFGLHSGALAARELGGTLSVHSDGPGTGATFTLELPLHPGAK